MPSQQIAQLTDRQRKALTGGKTVQWAADAFGIPRPQLVAMVAAEGWVIDPATDKVHARQVIPAGIHPAPKETPVASDTPTVLDALRSGTSIPQVAEEHGWSESSVRALVNGKKGWSIDPSDDSVRIGNGDGPPRPSPPAESAPRPNDRTEPPAEPAAAPTPTAAETVAGGIEQLLADARTSGDKRIERAAAKADAAIRAVVDLYEPWQAEQQAIKERAAKLAKAEERAAKLRAQLAEAQADVAALKGRPTRSTSAPKSTSASGRERSQAIRAWAKSRGIEVNERGRIPAHIAEQYDQEHGGGDGPS